MALSVASAFTLGHREVITTQNNSLLRLRRWRRGIRKQIHDVLESKPSEEVHQAHECISRGAGARPRRDGFADMVTRRRLRTDFSRRASPTQRQILRTISQAICERTVPEGTNGDLSSSWRTTWKRLAVPVLTSTRWESMTSSSFLTTRKWRRSSATSAIESEEDL